MSTYRKLELTKEKTVVGINMPGPLSPHYHTFIIILSSLCSLCLAHIQFDRQASFQLFFFFFMNGNTDRAQCALSLVCIPQEKEKKGSEKNKTSLQNI